MFKSSLVPTRLSTHGGEAVFCSYLYPHCLEEQHTIGDLVLAFKKMTISSLWKQSFLLSEFLNHLIKEDRERGVKSS